MNNKPCCAVSRKTGHPATPPAVAFATSTTCDKAGMVMLAGGKFLMGTEDADGFPADGEGPVREVELAPFAIDPTTVTNASFAEFVAATGYRTEAEAFGWSFVFYKLLAEAVLATHPQLAVEAPWWCAVPGACWNHPEGPHTGLTGKLDHPVVHVSWNDATAYCRWAGKRLPTEAEWEYAARSGLEQKRFPWGDELEPGGEYRCHIWHGRFPDLNTLADGWLGTAPARAFEPNGFGLYNMAGNVWEWCQDWFSADFHRTGPRLNPIGPPHGSARVLRGGSFLCHRSYCNRYRVAARYQNTPDSTTSNMGFRCVAA
ncbi:MAG: formylglycine-generating enzyme family protein [Rhodanobacteraceae bacterium]